MLFCFARAVLADARGGTHEPRRVPAAAVNPARGRPQAVVCDGISAEERAALQSVPEAGGRRRMLE
jgi:hypothetical protein